MKPSYSNFNIMNSQEQMDVYKNMEQNGSLSFVDSYRASQVVSMVKCIISLINIRQQAVYLV